jgi:hypothetical protein
MASLVAPAAGKYEGADRVKQMTLSWRSLAVLIPPALVMMLGAFLPWASMDENRSYGQEARLQSSWNGFNTVEMTKHDRDGRARASVGNMGITLASGVMVSAGFLIVICCVSTVLVAALGRPSWAICFGGLGIILGACMFLRIARDAVAAADSNLNVSIGLGIWLVLVGAVLVVLGGLLAALLNSTRQAGGPS